ncbi:hypothetical protein NE451_14355 [Bacteroides nordii]|jgi:hypothetical protein|uniref:hypothetical protein n=1 Tax=Bacteroides nordii TaxID=291645 RepID=UPI00206CD232|nr:hypothetical protein [Bacteroides nordii]MCQ4915674.1 hypothetical protein [Bacteroides nordii]DAM46454.1 MAG TPA: holin [Bacteriophage sp.]
MEKENSSSEISVAPIVFIIGTIIAFICLFNDHFFWCMIIMAITGGISSSIWQNKKNKKEREERKRRQEERKVQKQAEFEQKSPIYNAQKNELISKYGQPDKSILFEELNLQKEIIVFGKVNRIWLLGKDLPMSDILSCTFNDNQHTVKGSVSYETKTSTGNMAKRAIVGGVLTGGVGAVVGGATARKETTVKQENDKVIHDYTVIVNINSLSEPIVKIPLGSDGAKVNEIVGLMNVIISRNKG